jgi:tRNA dimethylallyltransferase
MSGAQSARRAIVLFGPTAVGKTAASYAVAQLMPVEIINMDVGQLYTSFSVGTAKPDWKQEPVPHHLFDIINEPRDFTVVEYRTKVLSLMDEIWKRGHTPLFVGGSGFYLKSLLFPPQVAQSTENFSPHTGTWQELHDIDPARAQHIKKSDQYRIDRALTIWHETGKKPSEYEPVYDPPASMTVIHLERNREELYNRINSRVDGMIEEGWLDEVRDLVSTEWASFIKRKKLIGYNELIDYISQDGHSLPAIIEKIKKRTRNYAKRQETFWRMLVRKLSVAQREYAGSYHIHAVNVDLTLQDVSLNIEQLLSECGHL